MTSSEFLFPIIQRNTLPDGSVDDPHLLRRMDNPICRRCHEQYQKKFPGEPFQIQCQGIYGEQDVKEDAELLEVPEEEMRELHDPCYWASKHVKLPDANGDLQPFQARPYQEEVLRCTSRYCIDRMARGLGKTTIGVIQELHRSFTTKNYPILIACPGKSQAKMWYDMILDIIKNDTDLDAALVSKQQAPFYIFNLANGSKISIYTTGSKSRNDADSLRGANPKRVRLDEQDLMNPGDYKAITALLRRYPKISQFHGSSTPTGKREHYWEMCTKYKDYREFFFPISYSPDWGPELEETLKRESRIEIVYTHEFLAEFGDQAGGVFKSVLIDLAKKNYKYSNCCYDSECAYFMGVDWNGEGTGTRIRVVEYNRATHVRRVVDHRTIDETVKASIKAIRELNRKWHCEEVLIDAGYGHAQDEEIREIGNTSDDPDDRRLANIRTVDFGASLKFNKFLPNRGPSKYHLDEELERRAKPFLVEGAVMVFEQELLEYSEYDKILDEQFRAYRVKNWSQHGWANTYEAGAAGDHDLDALMLALSGIENRYGIFYQPRLRRRHTLDVLTGFGQGPESSVRQAQLANQPAQPVPAGREQLKRGIGIPSREVKQTDSQNAQYRMVYRNRQSFTVVPNTAGRQAPQTSRGTPSRTAAFRSQGSRSFFPTGRRPLN